MALERLKCLTAQGQEQTSCFNTIGFQINVIYLIVGWTRCWASPRTILPSLVGTYILTVAMFAIVVITVGNRAHLLMLLMFS